MNTHLVDGVQPRPDDAELVQVAITAAGACRPHKPGARLMRLGIVNRSKQVYRVFEGTKPELAKIADAIGRLNFIDEHEEGSNVRAYAQYDWVMRGFASRY